MIYRPYLHLQVHSSIVYWFLTQDLPVSTPLKLFMSIASRLDFANVCIYIMGCSRLRQTLDLSCGVLSKPWAVLVRSTHTIERHLS